MGELQVRFNMCAARILQEPVGSLPDLILFAEATYWRLDRNPAGLWAPDAEAQLASEPAHQIEGVWQEAALALLMARAMWEGPAWCVALKEAPEESERAPGAQGAS